MSQIHQTEMLLKSRFVFQVYLLGLCVESTLWISNKSLFCAQPVRLPFNGFQAVRMVSRMVVSVAFRLAAFSNWIVDELLKNVVEQMLKKMGFLEKENPPHLLELRKPEPSNSILTLHSPNLYLEP